MPKDYKRKIIQVLNQNLMQVLRPNHCPLTVLCNDGLVLEWKDGKWVYLMTIPEIPQEEIEDLQDGQ